MLNEKRLTERAGFDAIQDRLAQPWPDLGALVSDVHARLGLRIASGPADNPAERLDWVPAVLASLDRPFVIDRPDELRGLVAALAGRLAASARAG